MSPYKEIYPHIRSFICPSRGEVPIALRRCCPVFCSARGEDVHGLSMWIMICEALNIHDFFVSLLLFSSHIRCVTEMNCWIKSGIADRCIYLTDISFVFLFCFIKFSNWSIYRLLGWLPILFECINFNFISYHLSIQCNIVWKYRIFSQDRKCIHS